MLKNRADIFEKFLEENPRLEVATVNVALQHAIQRRNIAFVGRLRRREEADPNYVEDSGESIPLATAVASGSEEVRQTAHFADFQLTL